jgi:uncharacterized protein YoxC
MSTKKLSIIAVSVVVLAGSGLAIFSNNNKSQNTDSSDKGTTLKKLNSESDSTTSQSQSTIYNNGDFAEDVNYKVPFGESEDIKVSLSLQDNLVTDVKVELNATNPKSKEFQGKFKQVFDTENFAGKKLEDVALSRVSGASLTTAAFDKAIISISQKAAR